MNPTWARWSGRQETISVAWTRAGEQAQSAGPYAFRIWRETSENSYRRPDGKVYELPGAAQMILDLGTINVEKTRGFSAYCWIRDELIRMGVPTSEIAFMQNYKKTEAKQRLFADVRAAESAS